MEIKVIGSGSSGNCYRISDGETALLLEAGLPIKKIKEGCDFDMASIAGCLITHEHGDHCKAVNDVMAVGIDVYMTKGTSVALNGNAYNHRLHLLDESVISENGTINYFSDQIMTFIILPFAVHHDAAQPVGYLIRSTLSGEKLLFVTDTYYIDYHFNELTHIMIEANYSNEALKDAEKKNRLRRSHMSIENCIEMLKANDLSHVKEIWLLHLSASNGDAEDFKRQVQAETGCEVYIA